MGTQEESSLKYIVPFLAGFSDEKNIGDKKLRFCQVRFLCEGGTKIWQDTISNDEILEIIKSAGLQYEQIVPNKSLATSDILFIPLKPDVNINTIDSWMPNKVLDNNTLYWRGFNFVLQGSTDGYIQYQTPIPSNISIEPFTVVQLINTVLKVYFNIYIE